MAFLEDLIGIKNLIAPDGTMMPRRYALSFEDDWPFRVEDDPINQRTVIRMGGSGSPGLGDLGTIEWTLTTDDSIVRTAGTGFCETIRLTSEGVNYHLIGISLDEPLAMRRKILVNVGEGSLFVGRTGAETPEGESIEVPGGSVSLPHNGAIEVVWMPAQGTEIAGWRLL